VPPELLAKTTQTTSNFLFALRQILQDVSPSAHVGVAALLYLAKRLNAAHSGRIDLHGSLIITYCRFIGLHHCITVAHRPSMEPGCRQYDIKQLIATLRTGLSHSAHCVTASVPDGARQAGGVRKSAFFAAPFCPSPSLGV
jgi:hypothetical protein